MKHHTIIDHLNNEPAVNARHFVLRIPRLNCKPEAVYDEDFSNLYDNFKRKYSRENVVKIKQNLKKMNGSNLSI